MRRPRWWMWGGALTMLLGLGCTSGPPPLTREELQNPEACADCHPDHFRQWSGSMHAYAGEDPVFLALNARGQRETNGALGDFCVRCHAPIAVLEGATKDGLNLAELPAPLRGVTCYFCHSVERVDGTHNNPLVLVDDGVLRGGIPDPVPAGAHASAYSPVHDRRNLESSDLCGSCHDIVTPLGAHIERTYAEWQSTLFAKPESQLTCGECHMEGRNGPAANLPSVQLRRVHDHSNAAVDVAITPFPEKEAQRTAVQNALDRTLLAQLCVKDAGSNDATVLVVLDNAGAGHHFTSGAAQDRRAWVEVIAYAGGAPIYESGVVPDGESITDLADPDLWLIRECMLNESGAPTHLFWEAASHDENLLPGASTSDKTDPAFYATHKVRSFPRPGSSPATLGSPPDRVKMRVRLIPIGLDVLDEVIASGDLDPSFRDEMPIFDMGSTTLEWTPETATLKYPDQGVEVSCVTAGISVAASLASPAPETTECGGPPH